MRAACAAAVFAFVLVPSLARAADPAAAREQLKIGYTLSQEGKCDEAVPHLVESLRLDPKAITLINLANCEEKVGRWADALGHWVDARARAQTENVPAIEEEAVRRAKSLEERIPRLTIVLGEGAPKGTEVLKDGVLLGGVSLGVPLPVDPGSHTVVARAPGRAEGTKTIALAEGETGRVDVAPGGPAPVQPGPAGPGAEPARAAPSGGLGPLVWIGFGTALVSAAVGTVTGIVALDHASEADRDCPNRTCTDPEALDRIDTGRTMGTISTVAFVVAGAGAAVGVVGLVTGGRRTDPSVALRVGPSGAFVAGRF